MTDPPRQDDATPEETLSGDATLALDVTPVRLAITPHHTPPEQSSGSTPAGADAIAQRYEIVGLLGSGGMGNVYKVRDRVLDEVVALKTLRSELSQDERALERFRREVKLARRVTHPNVARTYDLGTDAQAPYLTMEFVQGEPLSAVLSRARRLSPQRALQICVEVARGLGAAHGAGIIHRDLKPANVMITPEGRAVITDFGIARVSQRADAITAVDGMLGTPVYMAPEQVEGKEGIDHRADLYALGVMLYELVAGEPPFQGDSPVAIALGRLLKPAPRLSEAQFGEPVATLVARSLERYPQDRYPDADAWISGAQHALASLSDVLPAAQTYPDAPPATHSIPTPVAARRQSKTVVGVAPLKLHAQEEDDDYIAEGFVEELLGELSTAPNLLIKPLSVVRPALLKYGDPQEASRALQLDVIITGSIRPHRGELRIRLAMLSVADGFQIWGEKFTCAPSELFVAAEEAAQAIAAALTTDVPEQPLRPEAMTDPVAIEHYMRGRYVLQQNWYDQVDEALALFERAHERAPDDPRVLTGLATALARQVFFKPEQTRHLLERAQELATRASQLAPDWPDPHYALGIIAYNAGDFATTIRACRRALRRSPDHIDAHDLLGRVLTEVGPLDRAIQHLEHALSLNEQLFRARWELARAYALMRRWEEVDRVIAVGGEDPSFRKAGLTTKIRMDGWRGVDPTIYQSAMQGAREADERFDSMFSAVYDMVAGLPITRDHIMPMLDDARRAIPGSQQQLLTFQISAELALYGGHTDLAIEAVTTALDAGVRDLMWMEHAAALDSIRQNSRFEALLTRARARILPVSDALYQPLD